MIEPRQIQGVQVALPWPAKPLWPNFRSRTHWARTKAVKKARSDAAWTTKAAKLRVGAGDVPVLLQTVFFPPTNQSPDTDNALASMKASFDGIADAIGVDDKHFRHREPVIGPVYPGGCVVVRLEVPA